MTRQLTRFSALIAVSLALQAVASGVHAAGKTPDCVKWRAYAAYSGYGYKHIVNISNQCDKTAACDVSTSVNPDKQSVNLAPGASQDVITFVSSPAREFTATVNCSLK